MLMFHQAQGTLLAENKDRSDDTQNRGDGREAVLVFATHPLKMTKMARMVAKVAIARTKFCGGWHFSCTSSHVTIRRGNKG